MYKEQYCTLSIKTTVSYIKKISSINVYISFVRRSLCRYLTFVWSIKFYILKNEKHIFVLGRRKTYCICSGKKRGRAEAWKPQASLTKGKLCHVRISGQIENFTHQVSTFQPTRKWLWWKHEHLQMLYPSVFSRDKYDIFSQYFNAWDSANTECWYCLF